MDGFVAQFVNGLKTTVLLALVSGALGMALGLLAAAGRLSRWKAISLVVGFYTTIIRGVPELIIILLIYFGGTVAISAFFGRYVEVNAFLAGVVSLTVVFGAYTAEIFRGAGPQHTDGTDRGGPLARAASVADLAAGHPSTDAPHRLAGTC